MKLSYHYRRAQNRKANARRGLFVIDEMKNWTTVNTTVPLRDLVTFTPEGREWFHSIARLPVSALILPNSLQPARQPPQDDHSSDPDA